MTKNPAHPPQSAPSGAVPRRIDLFAVFVLALAGGAIAAQVALMFWLGSG